MTSSVNAAAVQRARAADGRYGCFVEITPASEIASVAGPLAGLTYAAKDMFDTPGRAPSLGLATRSDDVPSGLADVLRELDQNGAARLGFTRMTALAYEPSGANAMQGRPINPRDPHRICGGSSSGSAVAVAAGAVSFAVGSDTAGSLRIPAQCCGVHAWKPSHGLVPTAGAMPLSPSLDTIGFLAGDPAILQRLGAIFDPRSPSPVGNVLVARDVAASSDPEIGRVLDEVVRSLPVASSEIPILEPIADCDGPCLTILQAEAAHSHAARMIDATLDPALIRRLSKGAALPADRVREATAALTRLRAASSPLAFDDTTALLLPVMRIPTPRVEICEPGSADFAAHILYELSALTRFVNLLGWPAVAVPAGVDSGGAPVAIQLVGRPGCDRALLTLASDVHRALAARPFTGQGISR